MSLLLLLNSTVWGPVALGATDYLETRILDHVLGGVPYTPPATVYLALYTTSPGDSGGGVEVSGGGYQRVAVPNNATNWPAASGGQKSNGQPITFPIPTAAWGTVVAVGILDAPSGGNLLFFDQVAPAPISTGDAAQIGAGALTLTLD